MVTMNPIWKRPLNYELLSGEKTFYQNRTFLGEATRIGLLAFIVIFSGLCVTLFLPYQGLEIIPSIRGNALSYVFLPISLLLAILFAECQQTIIHNSQMYRKNVFENQFYKYKLDTHMWAIDTGFPIQSKDDDVYWVPISYERVPVEIRNRFWGVS